MEVWTRDPARMADAPPAALASSHSSYYIKHHWLSFMGHSVATPMTPHRLDGVWFVRDTVLTWCDVQPWCQHVFALLERNERRVFSAVTDDLRLRLLTRKLGRYEAGSLVYALCSAFERPRSPVARTLWGFECNTDGDHAVKRTIRDMLIEMRWLGRSKIVLDYRHEVNAL